MVTPLSRKALRASIAKYWTRFSRHCEALHVERQGMYSVEKLHDLKAFMANTSLFRAVVVLIVTPLPCIAALVVADMIPLAPPEAGIQRSHIFGSEPFSSRVFLVSLVVTAGTVANALWIAHVIGFPVPFYTATIMPGWVFSLSVGFGVVWGKYFKGNAVIQRQFNLFAYVVNLQMALTCVYPAYAFLFKQLSAAPQVAFAFLLPVIKLCAKNSMSYLLLGLEDAKPEFIIFTVDVFHALFVANCLQSSTSLHTTVVLTLMDFVFAMLSIRKVFRAISECETNTTQVFHSNAGVNPEDNQLSVGEEWLKPNFIDEVIALLKRDPSLLQSSGIRVRSHDTRRKLTRIHPDANPRLANMHFVRSASAGALISPRDTPRKANCKFVPASLRDLVQPMRLKESTACSEVSENEVKKISIVPPRRVSLMHVASPRHRSVSQPRFGIPVSLIAREHGNARTDFVLASESANVKYVHQALHLLYWTEFLLLIEFVEVMIPIIYCAYLGTAYHLPNRVYYAQLREIDEVTLRKKIGSVLLYALLEAISLITMGFMLCRKLRISSIRQLTFVLESQWQKIQWKLILWVVFSLQASLDHFGVDYTFKFVWLHPQDAGHD